jgi:hypothetical protein
MGVLVKAPTNAMQHLRRYFFRLEKWPRDYNPTLEHQAFVG